MNHLVGFVTAQMNESRNLNFVTSDANESPERICNTSNE